MYMQKAGSHDAAYYLKYPESRGGGGGGGGGVGGGGLVPDAEPWGVRVRYQPTPIRNGSGYGSY